MSTARRRASTCRCRKLPWCRTRAGECRARAASSTVMSAGQSMARLLLAKPTWNALRRLDPRGRRRPPAPRRRVRRKRSSPHGGETCQSRPRARSRTPPCRGWDRRHRPRDQGDRGDGVNMPAPGVRAGHARARTARRPRRSRQAEGGLGAPYAELAAEDDVRGVRAQCRKTMSAPVARSKCPRAIDMTGVTPLPPERKRYFCPGRRAQVKSPIGPTARNTARADRVVEVVRHGTGRNPLDSDRDASGRVGLEARV